MARVDFRHGVTFLSFFLLLLFIIQIWEYLDEQIYISVPLKHSFYENSWKLILVYTNYNNFLYACFIFFYVQFFWICDRLAEKVMEHKAQCYRLYFPNQCIVCLIPCIIRHTNTNDDVMYYLQWNRIFLVVSSILQFIQSYWWSVVKKCTIKRLVSYISETAIYPLIFSLLYFLCCNCLDVLKREEVSKEFLTVRSFFDHGSLFEDLNVNMENTHVKSLSLNQSLFQQTGQKLYQTTNSWSFRTKDNKGISLPYQRRTYYAGIGESVSLSCHAFSEEVVGPVRVLRSFNGKYLPLNGSTWNITTNVKKVFLMQEITSQLDIDFIENNEFGNYTCSFQKYDYIGKEVKFHLEKAYPLIKSIQHDIAQYSVKKHSGDKIFIYTTPGGIIDIRWKPMVFNNKIEDVIEYYYVNGVPYNRPKQIESTCSVLSHYFMVYGQASNWFFVPCTSQIMQFFENLNFIETRFTECAGSSIYGVHTVEYFRRIYNKKRRSYVLQEIKHPDTLYILPDFPYFLKMDNATKEKKNAIIQNLHKSGFDYLLYDTSIPFIWKLRIRGEHLTIFLMPILFSHFLYPLLMSIYCRIQKCRKKFSREVPDFADQCPVTYQCYIIGGDTDKNSVYNDLVKPLKEKNIKTGFNFEECSINKSGRSIFDILCDLLNQCEHLIFYITSTYLKEEKFVDIGLERVLMFIQNGHFSAKRVLVINADSCELPNKLRFNLPNVHDWVKVTKPKERIHQILKWIKSEKNGSETSDTYLVVSTAFLG